MPDVNVRVKFINFGPFAALPSLSSIRFYTNNLLVTGGYVSSVNVNKVLGIDLCYLPCNVVQEEAVVRFLP